MATCQPLSRMMVWLIKNVACCAAWPGSPLVNVTDDMVEVHRYLENSGQFGKIVVTL